MGLFDVIDVNKRVRNYLNDQSAFIFEGADKTVISDEVLLKSIELTESLRAKLRRGFRQKTFAVFIEETLKKNLIPRTKSDLAFQRKGNVLCVNWEYLKRITPNDEVSQYVLQWARGLYEIVFDV